MTGQHTHSSAAETRVGSGSDDSLLRLALRLDAVATGAVGLLGALAAPVLERLLGVPATVQVPLGLALLLYAAAVWLAAARSAVHRRAAGTIVGLNALWVVASVAAVATGLLPLTPLGVAFVVAQAGAVAVFAELQLIGLRRAGPAPAHLARA
jgi:hypothetical protein